MSNKLLEKYSPPVRYQGGINTNLPATFGGNVTVTGTLTANGASTEKMAVISGQGATATLTAAQSGSTVLFDRASGIVYTLPAPAVGLYYDFFVTVTVTSNSYKVITDAGTTLLIGTLVNVDTDSSNAVAAWTGNGSSHIAVTQAAASSNATGGVQGTWVRFTCVSSTLWSVQGHIQGAGTVATPFATS
jgi:hypothetical protein